MGAFVRHAVFVLVCLVFASFTYANSGIQLPLSDYQAGTETTTLVPNGDFESATGSDPNIWTEPVVGMSVDTHVSGTNTNSSVFGLLAAQGFDDDDARYTQSVPITPGTDYVLSAYIWNFGVPGPFPHDSSDNDPGDQAVVEIFGDGGAKKTLLLEPIASDGGNGDDGYFVYENIPASFFGALTSAQLDVRNDLDTAGPWPGVVTQYDNVALTPATQFQPPVVPEPASLSLLAIGGLALLRRRRA